MQDRALYSIKEGQELLGGISRNGIYAPVSYTHLDVYKRQVLH